MTTHRADGFTLPEVLLAIVLLAVGILGLASSATAIAVQAGDARRLTTGAALLEGAIDSLRAGDCRVLAPGTAAIPGARVGWRVTAQRATRAVHATLGTSGARRTHAFALDALLPCES